MKLHTGYLAKWKDEQGYGFIRSSKGRGKEVFLHINAFEPHYRRPKVGDVIYYQLAIDRDGRAYARYASLSKVRLKRVATSAQTQQNPFSKSTVRSFSPSVVFEVIVLALLPVVGSIHLLLTAYNPIPLILYPVMSWITYSLYATDKSRARAQTKGRRITEKTLHLYEGMGGWIGALIAQRKLRHKSRKIAYQKVFWAIVVCHQLFWSGWWIVQAVPYFSTK